DEVMRRRSVEAQRYEELPAVVHTIYDRHGVCRPLWGRPAPAHRAGPSIFREVSRDVMHERAREPEGGVRGATGATWAAPSGPTTRPTPSASSLIGGTPSMRHWPDRRSRSGGLC